ncbi:hypothetical protein pipiens_018285, partial [Culex pipiens pipiens]
MSSIVQPLVDVVDASNICQYWPVKTNLALTRSRLDIFTAKLLRAPSTPSDQFQLESQNFLRDLHLQLRLWRSTQEL